MVENLKPDEAVNETAMALAMQNAIQEALRKENALLKEKNRQAQKELVRKQETIDELEDRLVVMTEHADYDWTRLFRRETFEEITKEILSGSNVSGAFVILDLQGFGAINKEFGHPVGDRIISYGAEAIRRRMRARKRVYRERDYYCRLGGDEFALLLMNVKEEHVNSIVASIGAEARKIDERLSFYFGYAIVAPGDTFESLYERADEYLWAHKGKIREEKMKIKEIQDMERYQRIKDDPKKVEEFIRQLSRTSR